ncbi:HNH endonuclease signature motif containing protein [Streptomyces sp. NPDC005969]|uniref:HNH endonuclease signature motif containing protein n=1 Tax=Streptomyces sp. NPDC005969 TaxID=3156722 RepID=UPI0033F393B5
MNECTIEGCGGSLKASGLCNKHYLRLKRHGSPRGGGPQRYPNDQERLWSQVERTPGCWLWTGSTTQGYGYVQWQGARRRVHRVVYELLVGPITEGTELDHLCRIRHCCNPAHLEAVTRRVNNARGLSPTAKNRRKTHCPAGHEYDIRLERRGGVERRCSRCEKAKRRARTEREAATRQHLQQELQRHPESAGEAAAA